MYVRQVRIDASWLSLRSNAARAGYEVSFQGYLVLFLFAAFLLLAGFILGAAFEAQNGYQSPETCELYCKFDNDLEFCGARRK